MKKGRALCFICSFLDFRQVSLISPEGVLLLLSVPLNRFDDFLDVLNLPFMVLYLSINSNYSGFLLKEGKHHIGELHSERTFSSTALSCFLIAFSFFMTSERALACSSRASFKAPSYRTSSSRSFASSLFPFLMSELFEEMVCWIF